MVLFRAVLVFTLTAATCAASSLHPPAGFMRPPEHTAGRDTAENCLVVPEPFTGVLDFHSKYEGSDRARATLNPQAEAAYKQQTLTITQMERLVSRQVIAWEHSGNPRYADCVVMALNQWASAGALTGPAANHTGKSMRKWALATFSSVWLQLIFSPQHPLTPYPQQQQNISRWLGDVANLTAQEWRNLPLEKVNNHSYWAGWALMATAVVTGRQDLFDESLAIYRTAMQQVDEAGFLPNELRRRQRAFSYHNYALQPLVMIALFAQANGVDVRDENQRALQRLGARVIAGLDDASAFRQRTGVAQDRAFLQHSTNLAWLEAWCTLYTCNNAVNQRLAGLRPVQNTRLGGDLTFLLH